MDGHHAFEHLAHKRDDLVAALDYAVLWTARHPLLADIHHGVGGEDFLPSRPLLGVHVAEIARLELLDFFRTTQFFEVSHRAFTSLLGPSATNFDHKQKATTRRR